MLAARIHAKWDPKPEYEPTEKDIEGKKTYLGSKVWKNPELKLEKQPKPKIADDEVLIRVKACGICGSDIHMSHSAKDDYMLYPGLTAFPVTIGHEFSGIVEEAGKRAYHERRGKKFEPGEPVTSEEMIWCGYCRPCKEGYPNHCINLEEIGFSRDGAFAEYVKVPARTCWSIKELINRYGEEGFEAGALIEPTSVAYNTLFIRPGGFHPGAYLVIYGAGPIGLGAVALAKAAGAAKVIIFGHNEGRLKLAKKIGADEAINSYKLEKLDHEKILELTNGYGADMYVEAAGAFGSTWPEIEKAIWNGKTINAKASLVGRAAKKVPIWFEIPQVRRANIYGVQGHSGHGIFPSVIRLMASKSIDQTKIVTKRFPLKKVKEAMKTITEEKEKHAKILIKP